MKPSLLLLAALLLLPAAPQAKAEGQNLPKKDDLLVATSAAMPLREATPDPSFGGKAAQIGWVKKGEMVKVLSLKQYVSIFGLEVWIEVEKQGDSASHGWVFAGMSKEIQQGKASLAPVPASPLAAPEEEE